MIDQAVVMATGRAMRLGPLTKDRPRAMLPVLGKPMVARIMDRLREAGVKRFIVVVGEQEGAVVTYLNASWVPDAKRSFVLQTESRGMAHALSLAAPMIDGPFLLASVDHLTPATHVSQLIKRFDDFRGDVVLSTIAANNDDSGSHGAIVKADGQQVTSITDGTLTPRTQAAFMLYACGPRLLNYLNEKPATQHPDPEMIDPMQTLIQDGGRVAYVTAEWRLSLINDLDLLTINKRFLREGRDTHILSELPGSVHILPPVRIDPRVSIGLNAKIGPNVYLESGASIGHDAVIWDSMVLRDATVQPDEVLHGQIVARRARLSEPTPLVLPDEF